jgi:NADH:ubiquinone oxidoreductase subunit 2 (subunit N)
MAGVPPFVGFFTKLFILTLITNNSFTLFYTLFFVTMFIGLYFYIQNIKFLHSTNQRSLNYGYLNSNERLVPVFFYFLTFVLTVIILGILTIEDILLVFSWLLS